MRGAVPDQGSACRPESGPSSGCRQRRPCSRGSPEPSEREASTTATQDLGCPVTAARTGPVCQADEVRLMNVFGKQLQAEARRPHR